MRVRKLNESINNAKIIEGIFNIGAAKKLNTILQDCDNLEFDTVFGIWKTLYDALRLDKEANDKIVGNIDYKLAAKLYPEAAEEAEDARPFDYIADINLETSTPKQQDFLKDTIFGALRDLGDYLEETKNNKLAAQILKEFKDDFKKYQKWLDDDGNDPLEENRLGDEVEEGFLSKKTVKGEANKLTDFLTANADKIKSLADCAPYILDDISDVTINTAAAKDSEEMNTMIDIAGACAKEFGYPNFETLRADDDVEVHFEAAKYLSKFVDTKKLNYLIKTVKDEIADCERIEEELLKEDLGEDVGEYQEWVDYDMKKYGRISKETFDNLRKADLTVVKDEYGDYEVIPHEKIHEACKKRKVNKKLEESIIYTSEGLNNAMKEFAKVVRDWKKTHVDSQEEKVIAESNWDNDSFNTFIATLEG